MFRQSNQSLPSLAPSTSVFRPGENIWRTAGSDHIAFLVDGAAYFHFLQDVLPQAREQIWIVGWDFNPDIRVRPEDETSETLGAFLIRLVEQSPSLTIRIVVWSMGPVYSGKSLRMFRRQPWSSHPRIQLRFDTQHAIRGSHHQKFVSIDDRIAFVGGIDLTAKRWDTPEHLAESRPRHMPDGEAYGPVHDLQVAVEGEAASAVGDLARRRWKRLTSEDILPAGASDISWPESQPSALASACTVGFARTEPAVRGYKGCEEAFRLTLDALASARHRIFIETQYFASEEVCDILCEKLADPHGPEIVVIATCSSHGLLEKLVMGENRNRLVRRLMQSDHHGRFRAAYPVVPDARGGSQEVIIHSKVIIVDDTFLRVGSSNLNQRSERLDTELDVAIEGHGEDERTAIRSLRNRLLAEHLDTSPQEVTQMIETTGSMVAMLDALNVKARGLRTFDGVEKAGKTTLVFGTGLVDPKRPYWPLHVASIPFARALRRYLASWGKASVPASAAGRNVSLITSKSSPNGSGMKK